MNKRLKKVTDLKVNDMKLHVINLKDDSVHEVRKYIIADDGQENVWSNTWYGHHVIGNDCEWMQSTAKIEEGKGLPTDEEIDKKIFEICSKKRPWDGKSLPITAPEMLNELAQWFKNGTRNNEGEPISDAGFFSDN